MNALQNTHNLGIFEMKKVKKKTHTKLKQQKHDFFFYSFANEFKNKNRKIKKHTRTHQTLNLINQSKM